jgi:hypothetical protein
MTIGTRIACTVWQVNYRRHTEAGTIVATEIVATADPTGADLCQVARAVVLGPSAPPEHEFALLQVHRVAEVRGLARLEGDAAVPFDGVGAAVLTATEGHRARIGELSRDLALAHHELDMARRDLAAAASAYAAIREWAVLKDKQHEDQAAPAYEHAAELLATALGIVPDEHADTIPPPAPSIQASR